MIEINDMFYAKSSDAAIAEAGEYGGAVTTLLKFLLKEGIVDAVLAVDSSADLYDVVPILIEDPEKVVDAAGSLHFGTLNLAKFVTRYLDGAQDMKIAVTVKPCDAMTMVELMKREKVNADNVILVGINCGGTMPPVKGRMMMEQFYEVDPDSVVKEEIAKGKLIVETEDGTEKEIPIDVLEDEGFGRRTNCRRCEVNIPRMADLACGNWGVIGPLAGKATFVEVCSAKGAEILEKAKDAGVVDLEAPIPKGIEIREKIDGAMVKLADKWQVNDWESVEGREIFSVLTEYMEDFSRCLKCYGCREACPICYCDDCCLEANNGPDWLTKGEIPPSPMFHLERMLHMAESCTNCGQCEEVCPGEIPLAQIWHEVNTKIRSTFGYTKGIDEGKPPIAFFPSKERDGSGLDKAIDEQPIAPKPVPESK